MPVSPTVQRKGSRETRTPCVPSWLWLGIHAIGRHSVRNSSCAATPVSGNAGPTPYDNPTIESSGGGDLSGQATPTAMRSTPYRIIAWLRRLASCLGTVGPRPRCESNHCVGQGTGQPLRGCTRRICGLRARACGLRVGKQRAVSVLRGAWPMRGCGVHAVPSRGIVWAWVAQLTVGAPARRFS